jgi:hypothetical protein
MPAILAFLGFLGFVMIMLPSCMKKESYSEIPEIAYQDYGNMFIDTTGIAKKGVLTISFRDGDGDIGLNSWDTYPPYDTGSIYYYNYYIDYYEKRNGSFVKVDLTVPLRYRIPYLTPDDPNKAIKGIIVDTIPLNPLPVYDTIQFSMYIYDRALHKSNVVFTPEIVVRRP